MCTKMPTLVSLSLLCPCPPSECPSRLTTSPPEGAAGKGGQDGQGLKVEEEMDAVGKAMGSGGGGKVPP